MHIPMQKYQKYKFPMPRFLSVFRNLLLLTFLVLKRHFKTNNNMLPTAVSPFF